MQITDRDKDNQVIAAWVRVDQLEPIATLDGVRAIQTVLPPVTAAGSVETEGDVIHGAQTVRCAFSQRGAGIKMGVVSDGVSSRATAQETGDLPADGAGLTVLSDAFGGDEGTAMLEIIHDMVPEAELYFHDVGSNSLAFNSAIDALVAAGCDIICDDVAWLAAPFFEDGPVAAHVRSVIKAKGIIYVSAAGNYALNHYQGQFQRSVDNSMLHDFSGGTTDTSDLYVHIPAGSGVIVILQWDDPFGASRNDYDLLLADLSTGELAQISANIQNGNDYPIEVIEHTAGPSSAGDYAIIVPLYSGASDRTLEVFVYPVGAAFVYDNNLTPIDSIFGHQAVPEVVAVGAIDINDTGHDDVEPFSSQGPVTINSPAYEVRPKPDLCGVDRVAVTGAGGFPSRFAGTSAAAPHIAAVMAQLWAAMPQLSSTQIRQMVLAEAVDVGAPGFDNVSGSGRADILNVLNAHYAELFTFRLFQGFEDGMGDWVNVTGDDADWSLRAWTLHWGTGPRLGDNSPWYACVDTVSGDATSSGDTTILESPNIVGTDRTLNFAYHMHGEDIGSLSVDIFSAGTWTQDVWCRAGPLQTDRKDAYAHASVDLSDYVGEIRIRFRAVAVGGPWGAIAIDSIEVTGLDETDRIAPAAPTGLSLMSDEGTVRLEWDDNCDEDLASYTVYCGLTGSEQYYPIASGLVASDYVDDTCVEETSYDYFVTAVDTAENESLPSVRVTAGPPPSIWMEEGFETRDFVAFNWVLDGDADWTIASETSHSGLYSAQAGSIIDREASTLAITVDCPTGAISFYCKVSSEMSYDFLRFSIDGVERDRWSGERDWAIVTFPVEEGSRTFEWSYRKDRSTSAGQDTAWIDDVRIEAGI